MSTNGNQEPPRPDKRIELEDLQQVRALALDMVQSGSRSVDIAGRQLDPRLYDNDEFVTAVRQLAVSSRYARVRLLALDARQLAARGHRLVLLAQQLPSFISIRVPSFEHREFNEALLLVDERDWIHRRLADRFEGFACRDDRGEARVLARRFDQIWESAAPDPNFTRLGL